MNRIIYYGHSCFLVKTESVSFLIDPFITPNEKAAHIDVSELKTDAIFLTHGHADHIADVEMIAKNNGDCVVVCNYEVANYFTSKGLQTIGMNHGGTWSNAGISAKYVPAIHSSSLPDGSYGGNPGGWVFTTPNQKVIYVAGDTCLTMDMKLIPQLIGPVDLAILPIGGFFTMDAAEAIHAAKFVETKNIIGCHYDTFPPIEIDHAKSKSQFLENDLNLHLLDIGGIYEF